MWLLVIAVRVDFMDDDVDEISKDEVKIWWMIVTGWRERMMIVLTRMKMMNMIVILLIMKIDSNDDVDNDDGSDENIDVCKRMTNW